MRCLIALASVSLLLLLATEHGAQGQGSSSQKGSNDHKTTVNKGGHDFHGIDHKDIKVHKDGAKGSKDAKDAKDAKGQKDANAGKDAKTNKTNQKTQYYQKHVQNSLNSRNLKLDPGQQAALNKLASQQPLTYDDRQQLSDLLFNGNKAGLSAQDEAAISYLLTDDAARTEGAPEAPATDSPPPGDPLPMRVVNKTTEPIKVWIQVTYPTSADSEKGPETLRYDMQAGKAYDLFHKGEKLKASSVRIWALSPSRQWVSHRDQDLPLAAQGTSKVYVLNFAPPTTTATK